MHKDENTLDLLIDRESDLPTFTDLKVIDGITSDHFAVMCKHFLKKSPAATKTITTRNIRGIDIDSFCSDIADTDFDFFLLSCDVNHLANRYSDILGQTIEKTCSNEYSNCETSPQHQLYSPEISEEKKERRLLEHKWRQTQLEIDCQLYTLQKQKVNSLIQKA